MASFLKKTEVKLELLTDVDMLFMVEKGIRGGICNAMHIYAKANNKYIKDYNKVGYIYGWTMSEPFAVDGFDRIKDLSKTDEDSDKGYILEVDVKYLKNLHDLHSDLPFLPERMKIDKCNKLACNLYDKKNYVVHIRSLKQALG